MRSLKRKSRTLICWNLLPHYYVVLGPFVGPTLASCLAGPIQKTQTTNRTSWHIMCVFYVVCSGYRNQMLCYLVTGRACSPIFAVYSNKPCVCVSVLIASRNNLRAKHKYYNITFGIYVRMRIICCRRALVCAAAHGICFSARLDDVCDKTAI